MSNGAFDSANRLDLSSTKARPARKLLAAGAGINKAARLAGASNGTVARIEAEMAVT